MQRLYISHATNYPFREQLYKPILESSLGKEFDIIFPHDVDGEIKNSKDTITTVDMVIAEVSHPSTGQGIELGWADMLGKPIVGIYQEGAGISKSVKFVVRRLLSYKNEKGMIETIRDAALNKF